MATDIEQQLTEVEERMSRNNAQLRQHFNQQILAMEAKLNAKFLRQLESSFEEIDQKNGEKHEMLRKEFKRESSEHATTMLASMKLQHQSELATVREEIKELKKESGNGKDEELSEELKTLREEVREMKKEDLPMLNSAVKKVDKGFEKMTSQQEEPNKGKGKKTRHVEANQDSMLSPTNAFNGPVCVFYDFVNNTSLHGLKQIFSPESSMKKRLRHACLFVVVMMWFGMISTLAIDKYRRFDVTTTVEVVYTQTKQVPGITICSKYPIKKSYYGDQEAQGSMYPYYDVNHDTLYVRQQVKLGRLNVSHPVPERFSNYETLQLLSEEQKHKVWDAWFAARQALPDHYAAGGITPGDIVADHNLAGCSWQHTSYFTDYSHFGGICHTLTFTLADGSACQANSAELFNWLRLDYMVKDHIRPGKLEYQMHVHAIGEKVEYDTSFISLRPGLNSVQVKREDVENLPLPYGSADCETRGELRYYPRYSQYGCLAECKAAADMRQCGCHQWRNVPDPTHMCNRTAAHACSPTYNCSHCLENCSRETYSMSVTHTPAADNYVYLYLPRSRTVISQSPAFPVTSLVGEVGGTLGLCVGASLMSLMELLDIVTSTIAAFYSMLHFLLKVTREALYYNTRS